MRMVAWRGGSGAGKGSIRLFFPSHRTPLKPRGDDLWHVTAGSLRCRSFPRRGVTGFGFFFFLCTHVWAFTGSLIGWLTFLSLQKMPHTSGYRARTRKLFARDFRKHGMPAPSTYLTNFRVNDLVDIGE